MDEQDGTQQFIWHVVSQCDTLSELEKGQLYELLLSYSDVFARDKSDFGHTNQLQHEINTGRAARISQRVLRIAPAQRTEAKRLPPETRDTTLYQSMGFFNCSHSQERWIYAILHRLSQAEHCYKEGCLSATSSGRHFGHLLYSQH